MTREFEHFMYLLGGRGRGWGQGGEITQALYAHMINKKKKDFKQKLCPKMALIF
jgi:hypothetical protein